MNYKLFCFFTGLVILTINLQAQVYKHKKKDVNEVELGVALTQYYGDLPNDISTLKPTLHLGYRYFPLRYLSFKFNFLNGNFEGNDKFQNSSRGYSFISHYLEGSTQVEFYLINKQFRLKNYSGYGGYTQSKINVFIFGGAGMIFFSPKFYENNIETVITDEDYSHFEPVFPYGAGFKFLMNQDFGILLTLSQRLTFTDYLDEFSSSTGKNDLYVLGMLSVVYVF